MSFLRAEWRKLALANYEVDPEVLKNYLPPKTELDLWNGTCYVSLVGFMFLNTRLKGIRVPFHSNFEEVNLRFYVRYKEGEEWKRGVVFIKEIVPKPALTFVANTLYKEHYHTMPMKHHWETNEKILEVEYQWLFDKKWNTFKVKAERHAMSLLSGSEAEFITEHYWGYTKYNETTTFEYEVTHPSWEVYPVISSEIDVDFGKVYGEAFGFLSALKPKSVMLAEGSEITVENKRKL